MPGTLRVLARLVALGRWVGSRSCRCEKPLDTSSVDLSERRRTMSERASSPAGAPAETLSPEFGAARYAWPAKPQLERESHE